MINLTAMYRHRDHSIFPNLVRRPFHEHSVDRSGSRIPPGEGRKGEVDKVLVRGPDGVVVQELVSVKEQVTNVHPVTIGVSDIAEGSG